MLLKVRFVADSIPSALTTSLFSLTIDRECRFRGQTLVP